MTTTSITAGAQHAHNVPAKGAKFYSTDCRNANNGSLFQQLIGITGRIKFSLVFNEIRSPLSSPQRPFADARRYLAGLALCCASFIVRRGHAADHRHAVCAAVLVRIIALMDERQLTRLDRLLAGIGTALHNSGPGRARAARPNPAANVAGKELSAEDESHAARLMRVNHAGEIAAQGLYQGHAAVARDANIESQMRKAAAEELDHLGWCEERLAELNAAPSQLRPVWYAGAFTIGAISGILGDKWSLGFIAETERQVSSHLTSHLEKLPEDDEKSRAIVSQMRDEEEEHGANAEKAGAATLPDPAKALMRACARIMTRTAYWI